MGRLVWWRNQSWQALGRMEEPKDFEDINSTYWHMFSFSHLNVFLDRKPTGNRFEWKLKRFQNYFFMLFYFPFFLAVDVSGFVLGREADLPQMAFDISYMSHLVQVLIKMSYFLYFIRDIRELCLDFRRFHFSRHRPAFARHLLGKRSGFLLRLADRYYKVIYANLLFWSVSPLVIQPTMFALGRAGLVTGAPDTLIPKFFPVRYPFDETTTTNRILIAFMEIVVLTAGFIYFIPIDQFFVSVIVMACGAMDVLCASIRSAKELRADVWKRYGEGIGSGDDEERISLRRFVEDHQHILRITKKISEVLSPILALIIANSMVALCTLAIVITKKLKSSQSFVEFAREISGFCLVMITSLITLYLYSWMCGELKKSEEEVFFSIYSSDWYERDMLYKDSVLIIMRQSYRARPLKMLGIGDMDRETFIQGLRAIYSFYNFLVNFE